MKNILGLKLPTDPRWVDLASKSIGDILTDHAYCEQKAASSCISIIILYPEKTEIVEKLAPIVTEEWGHFRMVLKELRNRGFLLGRPRKDEYVNELMKIMKKGGSRDAQLLERLLLCALIEARSCERFKRLSEELKDVGLQKFYHDLMISEAGHYRLFIDLANTIAPEGNVRKCWKGFLSAEAEIMKNLEVRGDRVH